MIFERFLFRLPKEPDLALAAIAVLQEFERKLITTRREWAGSFEIMGLPPILKRCITSSEHTHWILVDSDVVWANGIMYDLKFDFDSRAAYGISQAQKMHATRAFGIMLGCDAPPFPDLKMTDTLAPVRDVLAIDMPDLHETCLSLTSDMDCDWFHVIQESRVIVSPRSLQTYLAATMGKDVVEIYPDGNDHLGWMSKYGRGSYHLVRGSLPLIVKDELTTRSIKICLEKHRLGK